MKFMRLFSGTSYKGTKNYIRIQKKYEIARTVLLFVLSIAIYVMGYLSTHTNKNLLTVVAVLGCLPASKSAVEMIMFLRYKSSPEEITDTIEKHAGDLTVLYDMVFTTYDKNFYVDHIAIRGNTVCGFSSSEKTDADLCEKHLVNVLKMDGIQSVSVKIFKDLGKYTERLEQMQQLEEGTVKTENIISSILSVSL